MKKPVALVSRGQNRNGIHYCVSLLPNMSSTRTEATASCAFAGFVQLGTNVCYIGSISARWPICCIFPRMLFRKLHSWDVNTGANLGRCQAEDKSFLSLKQHDSATFLLGACSLSTGSLRPSSYSNHAYVLMHNRGRNIQLHKHLAMNLAGHIMGSHGGQFFTKNSIRASSWNLDGTNELLNHPIVKRHTDDAPYDLIGTVIVD